MNRWFVGAMGAFWMVQGCLAEEVKPLESRDSWIYGDASAWSWEENGTPVLSLKRQSEFRPKVRSPLNLAWFAAREWESFTLAAEVRLDVFNEGNNDVCIAFGKQSDTRFYYAHLGESADSIHLHLHKVDDADREPITRKRAETLPWRPDTWHKVKVVRNARSGTIEVWFGEEKQPVLRAVDKSFGKGQIGLGSFDDIASFRNVVITEGAAK